MRISRFLQIHSRVLAFHTITALGLTACAGEDTGTAMDTEPVIGTAGGTTTTTGTAPPPATTTTATPTATTPPVTPPTAAPPPVAPPTAPPPPVTPPTPTAPPATTEPPAATVSYAAEVEPIFVTNCATCHFEGGFGGANGSSTATSAVNLTLGDGYAALTTQSSVVNGLPFVAATLEGSYLWSKLSGTQTSGLSMPFASKLPQADLDVVSAWILGGAQP